LNNSELFDAVVDLVLVLPQTAPTACAGATPTIIAAAFIAQAIFLSPGKKTPVKATDLDEHTNYAQNSRCLFYETRLLTVLQNTEIRENNNQQRKENRKKKEFSEKS
jgi:hypothetical protein